MGPAAYPNFREFIGLLSPREVRFLIVGGYAVAVHGRPRYMADLDVWVALDPGTAADILDVLAELGFGDLGIGPEDFTEPDRVVQLGCPPLRIDLMTSVDGVEFEEAYERRAEIELRDGLQVPFLSLADLRRNKEATGRAQDLADLEALRD